MLYALCRASDSRMSRLHGRDRRRTDIFGNLGRRFGVGWNLGGRDDLGHGILDRKMAEQARRQERALVPAGFRSLVRIPGLRLFAAEFQIRGDRKHYLVHRQAAAGHHRGNGSPVRYGEMERQAAAR